MPSSLPPGPYKTLSIDDQSVPWYIVPFDKDGRCTGPRTRDHLISELRREKYTDLFVFSHGWNNDWAAASRRYDEFIAGYGELRRRLRLTNPRPYRPLLAGVFWPSTALVMPGERGPRFAGHGALQDEEVAESQREVDELASALPPDDRERLYELLQQQDLTTEEEHELAVLLTPLWNACQTSHTTADLPPGDAITPADLVQLFRSTRVPRRDDDEFGGLADDEFGGVAEEPAAAPNAALSIGDVLNAPRDLVRAFTVLQMKDRAARVGASGMAAVLQQMTQASAARVHLVGHSYGCVVLLSAVCARQSTDFGRRVESMLLLQPAVSRFCFTDRVPGRDYPGGYRVAFERVVQPILSTFSRHDAPLTRLFHLAVRRDRDLGQPAIAGALPAPSKYAALGGYGPDGCGEEEYEIRTMHAVGEPYELTNGAIRLIALRADEQIKGHGDVSVPGSWWALYNQVVSVV